MALFVIADLHLSGAVNKSMDVFGRRWAGYTDKIKSNWSHLVTEADTVVIPGDISWGMTLDEALPDLKFIDSLPGKNTSLREIMIFGGTH
jgi:predicted phosphohydrolase